MQQFNLNRRHCIALAIGLIVAGSKAIAVDSAQALKPNRKQFTILVLGDSLSAEYGLQRGVGWVALLENKLTSEKIVAQVINASISGDTTSGGRARLAGLLTRYQPGIVVLELGGNDALRGLPMGLTQDNLNAMTRAAKEAGAKVLLLGMQVPPNYGKVYAAHFFAMFADVAKTHKIRLVPFLLRGVADVPDSAQWFQVDRIHPVAAAHPILLANIWPELKKLLP